MRSLKRQREIRQDLPKYDSYGSVRKEGENEEKRPWNFIEVVASVTPRNATILDCGCGNAFKLEELLKRTRPGVRVFAYDINSKLLTEAAGRIEDGNLPIDIFKADTLSNLPIREESVDMVTFMLAKHNAEEAHRVLKPGGIVVLERVGEGDKREVKELFGNDQNGNPRGYLGEYDNGELSRKYRGDFEAAGFKIKLNHEGLWTTYYTRQGLVTLLKATPFVRNFDEKEDQKIVERVIKKFSTSRGIALKQHRTLLIAEKRAILPPCK